jgi:hypothetical protein
VWFCVVWCGVVWCGVVWCGVVWCGAANDLFDVGNDVDVGNCANGDADDIYNLY